MRSPESALKEQFENLEQQHQADNLGMWVFLATEVLFFGGLFVAYVVYRTLYPTAFDLASNHLHVALGTINTIVLLASSFTMAMGVYSAQTGRQRHLVFFLLATAVLGALFLGIKVHEWSVEAREHLFPGRGFSFPGPYAHDAGLFFFLYFAMTGLHGLHLTIAVLIVLLLVPQALRGRYTREDHPAVEVVGLYWHYVDIVWIFLFPLLYLGGRHMHS